MNILKRIYILISILFAGQLLSSSKLKLCLQNIHSNLNIQNRVRTFNKPTPTVFGAKIEIGGGHNPVCTDCIQVDKFRGRKEIMMERESKAVGHKVSEAEFYDSSLGTEFSYFDTAGKSEFSVVTNKGVLSDANHLAFKSNSSSLITTKNFSWFTTSAKESIIRPILNEYKRVLKKGGRVYILNNGEEKWKLCELHRSIAESLGFKVTNIKLEDSFSSGILLELPSN